MEGEMKISCSTCRHSEGIAMGGLFCNIHFNFCNHVCDEYEREPGSDDGEFESKGSGEGVTGVLPSL